MTSITLVLTAAVMLSWGKLKIARDRLLGSTTCARSGCNQCDVQLKFTKHSIHTSFQFLPAPGGMKVYVS